VLGCVAIAYCLTLAALGSGMALPEPPVPTVPSFAGSSVESFDLVQSVPGAVTEVPDPAGSTETVLELTVSDDDVYPLTPTVNPRAELHSPTSIQAGDEFWWSAKFLLPRRFPARVPGWVTLLQGPYGPPYFGTPPWHIEVHRGRIQWGRNRTYDWDVPWKMPLVRGRWIEVMVHGKLARRGFVEMWVDGRRVTFFDGDSYNPGGHPPTQRLRMRTLDESNDGGRNYVSLLNYRKRGMFPSVTVYQGPLLLGPTQTSVTP
jgi:hypothetical protein